MEKKKFILGADRTPDQTKLLKKKPYTAPDFSTSYIMAEPLMNASSLRMRQDSENFNQSWETDPNDEREIEW